MDSAESPLDVFHKCLDRLIDLVRVYVRDLDAKAKRDDAIMKVWTSGKTLTAEQKRQYDEFQSWIADTDFPANFDPIPQVGAESCMFGISTPKSIVEAFKRCREAAGYGPSGEIPQQSLEVFEMFIEKYPHVMTARLKDWPRTNPFHASHDVAVCCGCLSERKPIKVIELAKTEKRWWHTENNAETAPNPTEPNRPNAARDATWVQWSKQGMTPAKIRDRWNEENPGDKISVDSADNGRSTVKKAIARELDRQKNL